MYAHRRALSIEKDYPPKKKGHALTHVSLLPSYFHRPLIVKVFVCLSTPLAFPVIAPSLSVRLSMVHPLVSLVVAQPPIYTKRQFPKIVQ